MKTHSVAVIIVNWNHGDYINKCLDSLLGQGFKDFEISLVDNGSNDGSIQGVVEEYPGVSCHQFPTNTGFCHAFNWGVKHTNSEFVLSLNPDVFLRSGFLKEIVVAIRNDDQIGIVSPKLLQFKNPAILDSTGLFINRYRRPYDRGQGEMDKGQYDGSDLIFGACGAAALYRRAMLEDIALGDDYLDEDFFAYYEDADIAWRAQQRGWKCKYAPKAIATHVRGYGDTLRKSRKSLKMNAGARLALRNRYFMTLKNDSLKYFLLDLPMIFFAELSRLFYMTLFAPHSLLGFKDFLLGYENALKKRRLIRQRKIVDDGSIRVWFVPQHR